MVIRNAAAQAAFRPDKMGKVALAAGSHLYAGLNCFQPGQEHAAHVHADQDKLYYVVAGSGEATLGEERHPVTAGDLVLATAGVPHGLHATAGEELVVLVVFGPPPVA